MPDWMQLKQLQPGQVVRGKIKRVEAFGVFVQLHNSSLTGLAHKSELSDDFVKDPADVYQAGQGNNVKQLHATKPAPADSIVASHTGGLGPRAGLLHAPEFGALWEEKREVGCLLDISG